MRAFLLTCLVTMALMAAGPLAAEPAQGGADLPGLKAPSLRVAVDQSRPMPASGSIGWGLSVFRVESGTNLNLSAVNDRLRHALRNEFALKGFTYVEKRPDYLVSYALAAGGAIDEDELNRMYGDALRMPAAETNAADSVYFTRGVLVVDVVDREAKHLLWRGAIVAQIDLAWPEARKQERCDAAVGQLMRHFPLPPD